MCCANSPPETEIQNDIFETQIFLAPRAEALVSALREPSSYDTFLNYVYGFYALTIAYFTNREMFYSAHAFLESRVYNR